MNQQTALITGATSGIGLEFAKIFAAQHYTLILVARNQEELNKTQINLENQYKIKVHILAKDLSQTESPQQIYDFCKQQNLQIDVLINNAGYGVYGPFIQRDIQKQLNMLDLNIRALTYLTGLFLPEMVKRKSGKILNVASTAAFQPGPFCAGYYASKAYVLSFSQALRSEVRDSGIFITCLCPGPTKTNFFSREPEMEKIRLIEKRKNNLMSPQKVAQAGFNGLMKNKAIVIPGFVNRLLAFGSKIGPRSLVIAASRWTLEK